MPDACNSFYVIPQTVAWSYGKCDYLAQQQTNELTYTFRMSDRCYNQHVRLRTDMF